MTPLGELPEPMTVFKTVFAVVGAVVVWKFASEFLRIGRLARRAARDGRGNTARLAELHAEASRTMARSMQGTPVPAAAQGIVSLLGQLERFLREAPTWETPEIALPRVDAFHRAARADEEFAPLVLSRSGADQIRKGAAAD